MKIGSNDKRISWENKNIRTKRFRFQIDMDLNEEQQKYILEKVNEELKNQLGTKYKLKKYFLNSRITVIAEKFK